MSAKAELWCFKLGQGQPFTSVYPILVKDEWFKKDFAVIGEE